MRISSITLQTKNVAALAAFYRTVLELPVMQSGNQFTITLATSTIEFTQAAEQEPFYHFALTIPSNKIEEAKAWLQQRTTLIWIDDYKSVVADFVNWNAQSLYFFDAAGNVVELIARFDLNNAAEASFSSKQFLSISEIGLVFREEEIENRTSELLHQYSLDYFSKQPPSPNFKAIGDEEGLFIVVTNNRNWYPTSKASAVFPLQMQFEVNGKKYEKIV